MASRFGGVGVSLPLNQQGTNTVELQAGAVYYVPPGTFNIRHGSASTIQTYDPVLGVWRPIGYDGGNWEQVDSDGNNYRVANQTGCAVAALLTQAGTTGYTSPPTVTPSAGGSAWQAILGSTVSSITVTATGANYVYPPIVLIQAPGFPGIPAAGYSTLNASGGVASVTMNDVGAGYTTVPFITFWNDPRDTTGGNAAGVAVLAGLGTVTGLLCTNHGSPITSGTVPTLTFSGGGGASAAAVAIMDWAVTSYAVTGAGSGYAGALEISTIGTGIPTTATAYTNPNTQASFLRTNPPQIVGALSGTGITATGQILVDSGHIGGVTSNIAALIIGGGAPTTVATLTLGVGGVNSYLWIQQG
jgi:hypothetical protein